MEDEETINLLLVWVGFLVLPVQYYMMKWLHKAGNKKGRTLKVDDTTLFASRRKFERVCVKIDNTKPLKEGYILRGRSCKIQYGGLNTQCFECRRYGHNARACPGKSASGERSSATRKQQEPQLAQRELHLLNMSIKTLMDLPLVHEQRARCCLVRPSLTIGEDSAPKSNCDISRENHERSQQPAKIKEQSTSLPKISNLNGSRFGVLDTLSEDEFHFGNLDPLILNQKGRERIETRSSIDGSSGGRSFIGRGLN